MPPLRSVMSCSPSARARTVTAHSLKAIGIKDERPVRKRLLLEPAFRPGRATAGPLKIRTPGENPKSPANSDIICHLSLIHGDTWRSQTPSGQSLGGLDDGGVVILAMTAAHRGDEQAARVGGRREGHARCLGFLQAQAHVLEH